MNYPLNQIPERTEKPRQKGLTMVMDKGLSLREVEDFIEMGGAYTDIVKLGWATSFVTPNLKEKLALYRAAGIPTYFGGTLFEAFIVNSLIGGGMTSKLYQAVREKQGLAYSVYSGLNTQTDSGNITIYAATDPKKVKKVIQIIHDELLAIKKEGIKKSDLNLFKTQVRGQLLMGSEDSENRMSSLGVNEMIFQEYRPVDRVIREIEAIDQKSVNDYIKNYFDLDKMSVILMGPKASENKSWLTQHNFSQKRIQKRK